MTTSPVTHLTEAQLAFLRDEADRIAGPFVDPRRLSKVQQWWTLDYRRWGAHVIGRPVGVLIRLSWRDIVLLDLAHEAEPDPPPDPVLAAERAHYAAIESAREQATARQVAARYEEWHNLHTTLGIAVVVAHNYTSHRHYDGYVQGGDHIIVLEDLAVGRLVRSADMPLCYTPSRAKDLEHFPNHDQPDERVPNCQTCIRTAYRIAGREPSPLLLHALRKARP